jgi:hypothetical protein
MPHEGARICVRRISRAPVSAPLPLKPVSIEPPFDP